MIYSVSRRTDMVAFHPEQIVDKVRRARKLQAIIFWTKDIRNLCRLPELAAVVKNIPSVIQYTVTGLAGTVWERDVPPLASQLDCCAELGAVLPAGAVQWRFDPILPVDGVRQRFSTVKKMLETALGGLEGVTVSFADPYRKAVARVAAAGLGWPTLPLAEKRALLLWMADHFPHRDAPVRLCCEPDFLDLPGVGMARCVDAGLLERLYGIDLGAPPKDAGQRKACGCHRSTDIGKYDMQCPHGCMYCYANPAGACRG